MPTLQAWVSPAGVAASRRRLRTSFQAASAAPPLIGQFSILHQRRLISHFQLFTRRLAFASWLQLELVASIFGIAAAKTRSLRSLLRLERPHNVSHIPAMLTIISGAK